MRPIWCFGNKLIESGRIGQLAHLDTVYPELRPFNVGLNRTQTKVQGGLPGAEIAPDLTLRFTELKGGRELYDLRPSIRPPT